MKKIYNLIYLLLVVVMSISFSACDVHVDGDDVTTILTSLPAPTISKVENDYVSWYDVPNAYSYVVKINSYQASTSQLSYSITSLIGDSVEANVPTVLHIYVKAKGNQILYADSNWSEEFTYTYTKTAEKQKVEIYDSKGIGRGIDVVSATNYNNYKTDSAILDFEKLTTDDCFYKPETSNLNNSKSTNSSSTSIVDFVRNSSVTVDLKVKNNEKVKTMFNNIQFGLNNSTSVNFSSYKGTCFYLNDQYREKYTISLKKYNSNPEKYIDYLDSDYLVALDNLYKNQNTSNFENFYKIYGTHIIGSGVIGGRLNIVYSIVTTSRKLNTTDSSRVKASVNSGISKVNNTKVSSEVSSEIKTELQIDDMETSFYACAVGGDGFSALTMDDIGTKISDWSKSLDGDSKDVVLVNFDSECLIALWDLLPSKYSSMKEAMQDAFTTYQEKVYNGLINKYTNETRYEISNVSELYSIRNNDGENVCFELTNDIDLSETDWVPISELKGTLNGNGYTIKNIKINTTEPTRDEERIYNGFIYKNSGEIKNINFKNINIETEYRENTKNKRRGYGGIVSINYGSMYNVCVDSCHFKATIGFKSDKCFNASDIEIDIGGLCGRNYGNVSFSVVKNTKLEAYTDAKQNHCLHYNIVGGLVGENCNEISDCISYHNNLYSYSTGGDYILFHGSGDMRCWSGYIIGNNHSGSVLRCVSYGHDSQSNTIEVNDFKKYTGVQKYKGLVAGRNNDGSFDQVYCTSLDSMRFNGEKDGYSENVLESTDKIARTVAQWSNWEYTNGQFNFKDIA